jgi:hypothetical protein
LIQQWEILIGNRGIRSLACNNLWRMSNTLTSLPMLAGCAGGYAVMPA